MWHDEVASIELDWELKGITVGVSRYSDCILVSEVTPPSSSKVQKRKSFFTCLEKPYLGRRNVNEMGSLFSHYFPNVFFKNNKPHRTCFFGVFLQTGC